MSRNAMLCSVLTRGHSDSFSSIVICHVTERDVVFCTDIGSLLLS